MRYELTSNSTAKPQPTKKLEHRLLLFHSLLPFHQLQLKDIHLKSPHRSYSYIQLPEYLNMIPSLRSIQHYSQLLFENTFGSADQ
jgi:hypothetical protein